MDRLTAQLQRLYFRSERQEPEMASSLQDGEAKAFDLTGLDGMLRAFALDFRKSRAWGQAAALYRALQDELGLPAPAVSVSGGGGYRLWFSLADPIPVDLALRFLAGLRCRYLADVLQGDLIFHPEKGRAAILDVVPACHEATGKWAAFIDPSMGAMFIDESGLEMAPNPDRQADLLSALQSMKLGEFQQALALLEREEGVELAQKADAGREVASPGDLLAGKKLPGSDGDGRFADPQDFLLAVMNDPSLSVDQRIEAAKALLPYFRRGSTG